MRWLVHLLALTAVIMAGTWWGGWWFVPIAGALYGAWAAAQRAAVLTATAAGSLAWIALLAIDATQGPMTRLLNVLGGVLHLPGAVPLILTVAYAALLASCSAAFARAVTRLASPV